MENMPDIVSQTQTTVDVKLDYLQRDIREIKADVKDIKSDFIARREFNEALKEVRERYDPLLPAMSTYKTDKARLWIAIVVLMALGGTIITLSIMAINSKIKVGIDEALSQYNIEIR